MTISLRFIGVCLAGASLANAFANHQDSEFGRSGLQLKRRDTTVYENLRRKEARVSQVSDLKFDVLEFSDLDRELLYSMSMSMSFGGFPGKPSSPSTPSQNPDHPSNPSSPSNASPSATSPTFPENPSASTPPSTETPFPTFQTAPSQAPLPSMNSIIPSDTGAPTFTAGPATTSPSESTIATEPTVTNITSVPVISPTTVFDISEDTNGVVIVEPPYGETTVVRLEIVYLVGAFVNTTADFEADIDALILQTSVVASLQANNSGVLDQLRPSSRRLVDSPHDYQQRELLSSSSFLRTCNATIDSANCYVMKADIVYILNGSKNADMSAYLAYLALSSDMATFDEGLPHVARVEYIRPQPKLPQNTVDAEESSPDDLLSSRGTRVSLSPISIGAVAMAALSSVLLIGLLKNRNRRRNRHHELLEDVSVAQSSAAPRERAQVVSHPL